MGPEQAALGYGYGHFVFVVVFLCNFGSFTGRCVSRFFINAIGLIIGGSLIPILGLMKIAMAWFLKVLRP